MPAVSITRLVKQRHELQQVGARDEQQYFVSMVPAGTSLASAAKIVAGGGQHEARRGLERGHVEWTARPMVGPSLPSCNELLTYPEWKRAPHNLTDAS